MECLEYIRRWNTTSEGSSKPSTDIINSVKSWQRIWHLQFVNTIPEISQKVIIFSN